MNSASLRRRLAAVCAFWLLGLLAASPLSAQGITVALGLDGTPPANDKCDNAIAVSEGVICFCTDFSTTTDVPDGIAPMFVGDFDIKSDIWYCYTATCNGTARIRVTGVVGVKVAVYDGCDCDNKSLIEAAPDCRSTATLARVKIPVNAGDMFLIRIGSCTGKTGPGMLDISCIPNVDPHDLPSCKKKLLAGPVIPYNFLRATNSGEGAFTMSLSADLWFGYTATCDEDTTFSLCGSSPGTLVAVYLDDGTPPGSNNLLASDFMGCMMAGEVTLPLVSGQDYTIQVGQPTGLMADGVLQLSRLPSPALAPPNDSCMTPMMIPDSVAVPFDTSCATTDGAPDPLCNFFGDDNVTDDLWYCYTASCSDMVTVKILNEHFDSKLAVYDMCGCPSIAGVAPIACNDDALLTDGSEVSFPAVAGAMYAIRVGGALGFHGAGELLVTCAPPTPAPINDLAAMATPAVDGMNPFTTLGAETDGPGSCECDPKNDVWFIYTPSMDGAVTLSTCGMADFDTYLAAYPIIPSNPTGPVVPVVDTHLACDDDSNICDLHAVIRVPVIGGIGLLIRVGGYGGLTGSGVLTVMFETVNLVRGDCNDDGMFNIADAVRILNALFGGGTFPSCADACDANDDGGVDIADPVTILNNLFGGLPVPIPPPTTCGPEPTQDGLSCDSFTSCP